MELQIEDFNEQITTQLKNLFSYIDEYLKLVGFYNPSEKHKTDRLMIKISFSINSIKQIVSPALSVGEIYGLPREATSSADEPDVIIVDLQNPNWDFKPWFYEKFNNMETAYGKLLEIYETDISTIKIAPNAGMKPIEYVVDRIRFELRIMKSYSDVILQMFESGRLSVKDVRLAD